jgi:hypothetical protein
MVILRNAPNIYEFEGVRFYPGINNVPDEVVNSWKETKETSFEKNFTRQFQGERPAMVLVTVPAKDGEKSPNDIKELILSSKPSKAIEIIQQTLLIDPLQETLKEEKRKNVIEALVAQIAEIKRKPTADELLGGVKPSVPPPTGNLMDSLNISHEFKEPDKY